MSGISLGSFRGRLVAGSLFLLVFSLPCEQRAIARKQLQSHAIDRLEVADRFVDDLLVKMTLRGKDRSDEPDRIELTRRPEEG